MAEIPSDIAASAAQAPFQARETVKEREVRRAGQAHAANRQVRTVDEAGTTVETTDADARVFADAEGQGGQGRQLDDETNPPPENPTPDHPKGITADKNGQLHLDLEA